MVDVGGKPVTDREAVARGSITMSHTALRLVRRGAVKKGDPLQAARLAGIMAAKRLTIPGLEKRVPRKIAAKLLDPGARNAPRRDRADDANEDVHEKNLRM